MTAPTTQVGMERPISAHRPFKAKQPLDGCLAVTPAQNGVTAKIMVNSAICSKRANKRTKAAQQSWARAEVEWVGRQQYHEGGSRAAE